MKPLIYLELRHLVNAIRFAGRQPKRMIPIFLIGLMLIMSLLQSVLFLGNPMNQGDPNMRILPAVPVETVRTLIVVLLTIGSAAVLYSSFSSGLMIFSLAQIDFLFPLPIQRRSVLVMKLLKDYGKYALMVTFMYLVLGPMLLGLVNVPVLPWGLVSIAALTALIIFLVNASNVVNIVYTFGFARMSGRQTVIRAVITAVPIVLTAYLGYQYLASGGDPVSLVVATNSAVIKVVLAPISWCAELVLAPLQGISAPEDYIKLAGLWLLAGLSFLALVSRKENIYEPSLGVSARYARRRQAIRSGGQIELLTDALQEQGTSRIRGMTIPPFGRGAVAFFWKNLLVRYRLSRKQAAFLVLMPLIIVYAVKVIISESQFLHFFPVILVYAVWVMALSLQGDARADLRYASIAKTIPVASWKIILAQTATYALFVLVAALTFGAAMIALLPQARTQFALAALLASPCVGFATIPAVLIPSMLYPDTRDMIQNYLCGLVSVLLSGIAVLPGASMAIMLRVGLDKPLYYAVGAACAYFLFISAVGIAIAGAVYEKFEPTGE